MGSNDKKDAIILTGVYEPIYRDDLKTAENFVKSLSGNKNYKKLRVALKDKRVFDALKKKLDGYVEIGVESDLRLINSMYTNSNSNGNLDEKNTKEKIVNFLKKYQNNGILTIEDGFLCINEETYTKRLSDGYFPQSKDGVKEIIKKKVYFDYYINKKVKQRTRYDDNGKWSDEPQEIEGVKAFYDRYPMIKHAVKKIIYEFNMNLSELCKRVSDDWNKIIETFFENNESLKGSLKLSKIESTGSDSHKGGKQVQKLTFTKGKSIYKLIYKPSDIEIDYYLFGNHKRSLFNVLNEIIIDERYGNDKIEPKVQSPGIEPKIEPLPTYTILPMNCGSELNEDEKGIVDIGTSYGYAQFLTHNKEDFKECSDEEISKYMSQVGELIATAFIFSMFDIHFENVIVHKKQPHLIDGEMAFCGPMRSLEESYIIGNTLGNGLHPKKYDQEKLERDGYQNYLVDKNKRVVKIQDYVSHLIKGFYKMLSLISNNAENFKSWCDNNISKCITRFPARGTAEFKADLNYVYSMPYFTPTEFNRKPFNTFKIKSKEREKNDFDNCLPNIQCNASLETEENSFQDYLNCDIPAYYHRVNEKDLRNARGKKVEIVKNDEIKDFNYKAYFHSGICLDVVKAQLTALQKNEINGSDKTIDEMATDEFKKCFNNAKDIDVIISSARKKQTGV